MQPRSKGKGFLPVGHQRQTGQDPYPELSRSPGSPSEHAKPAFGMLMPQEPGKKKPKPFFIGYENEWNVLFVLLKSWVTGRKMARPEQQEWTWKFSTWTLGTLSQVTGTTGEKQDPYRTIYCICKLFVPLKHFFKSKYYLALKMLYNFCICSWEEVQNLREIIWPHSTWLRITRAPREEGSVPRDAAHIMFLAGQALCWTQHQGMCRLQEIKVSFFKKKKHYQQKRACELCSLSYLSHVPERAKDRQPSVSHVPAVAVWHQRCFRGAFGQLLPFHNIWLGRRLLFFLRAVPAFWLFFQI